MNTQKEDMNTQNSADTSNNFEDLGHDSSVRNVTVVSARTPVHYPWWIHLSAAAIFLANCVKIPRSIRFVHDRLSVFVSDGSAVEASDAQAATAGVVVLCILSGLIGAVLMYVLHRQRARAHNPGDSVDRDSQRISMWPLIVASALILPDLWFAAVGSNPYSSWIFLSAFSSAVVVVTLLMGRAKGLLATLPVALLLGFAL